MRGTVPINCRNRAAFPLASEGKRGTAGRVWRPVPLSVRIYPTPASRSRDRHRCRGGRLRAPLIRYAGNSMQTPHRVRPGVPAYQRSPPQRSARASALTMVEACSAAAGRVSVCSKSEDSFGSISTDAAYYINQFFIILFMIFPAKIMDMPRTAGRLLIVWEHDRRNYQQTIPH